MAKADENDSIEPTSPASSTPDDNADRDDAAEADAAAVTPDNAEYVPADGDIPEELQGDEPAADSDDADADDTDADDSDASADGDLVAVGAAGGAAAAGAGVAGRRGARAARAAKKDKPTPKQNAAPAGPRRTTPPEFVRQSVAELRKVVYPTGQQLGNYFVVVLIFVLFIIAIVSLLDLAFGWVILRVFS